VQPQLVESRAGRRSRSCLVLLAAASDALVLFVLCHACSPVGRCGAGARAFS
jgi:hypothetical protein